MLTAAAIAFHWDTRVEQKIAQYIPSVIVDQNEAVQTGLEQLEQPIPQQPPLRSPKPIGHEFTSYGPAPEFMGLTNWINSPPLSLKELRGRVVLIDFWTYSCINCLRTLPHLEDWYKKYRDKGFVIIGIHTPEFEFEKNPSNVLEAVSRLGITYPVAQDNDYTVWREYNNRYWPAHYLIDQKGQIVSIEIGEGKYEQTEKAIQGLLGISEKIKDLPETSQKPITAETYLGTNRGRSYTKEITIIPNQTVDYTYSQPLQEDRVGLQGPWKAESERITAQGDDCYLSINCLASNIYIVLGGSSPNPVEVSVDGTPSENFYVNFSQKYDITNTKYGRHIVSLKIPKEISAYAFTFGSE
jgi:thiol-disulfide isomerase/thioredoxin